MTDYQKTFISKDDLASYQKYEAKYKELNPDEGEKEK